MQRDLDRQPYSLEVDSQRVGRRVTVEDGTRKAKPKIKKRRNPER